MKDLMFKNNQQENQQIDMLVYISLIKQSLLYGQAMTANFNENPSGSECQLSSMIQGTSRRIEDRRSKTS